MDQSPQGFASEDEEATYCLSLLRDGDRHQKIVARERLSQIFERRGLLDEAAQCLESNIREGIRDPRVYQRLAGVYRRQGRHELADEVLVEAGAGSRANEAWAAATGWRARPARPSDTGARHRRRRPGHDHPLRLPALGSPNAGRMAPAPAPPPDGGELGDGPTRRVSAVPPRHRLRCMTSRRPPPVRPWWLSPAMVVVLILLCGPYGLAMMWVRGGYPAKAAQDGHGGLGRADGADPGAASVTFSPDEFDCGSGRRVRGLPGEPCNPRRSSFRQQRTGQQPQIGSQPADLPSACAAAWSRRPRRPRVPPEQAIGTPGAVIAPGGTAAAARASPVGRREARERRSARLPAASRLRS